MLAEKTSENIKSDLLAAFGAADGGGLAKQDSFIL